MASCKTTTMAHTCRHYVYIFTVHISGQYFKTTAWFLSAPDYRQPRTEGFLEIRKIWVYICALDKQLSPQNPFLAWPNKQALGQWQNHKQWR